MVFKHDERSTVDDSFYFPYRHSRQVHSGVQLDSIAEGWEGREIVDNDKAHAGEKHMIHSLEKYFESNRIIAIPDNLSEKAHADSDGLPKNTSDKSDGADRSDSKHYRSSEEESCTVAFKRARHTHFYDHPPLNDLHSLGNGMKEPPASVDVHTSREAAKWELPMQVPLSPRFIDKGHPPDKPILLEDSYDRFPRKHVALGPDHQVDVPSWGSKSFTDYDEESSKRMMGTSILPMPDIGSMAIPEIVRVGVGVNYCNCIEKGSISCIRRHVAEARERSREALSLEKFVELGFHDMGEDVALRWTEEEEQLFRDVVLANPASLGKNFWNVLPQVFPCHRIKDLVSYYFNVFILRKRAEQNRDDPWNVDSDNDEWQESDDGEFTMDDSGQGVYYQSPVDQKGEVYLEEEEEDDDEEEDDYQEEDDEEEGFDGPGVSMVTNAHGQLNFSCKSRFAPNKPLQNTSQDSMEEHDAHDDSCTSYEGQHGGVDSCADPFIATTSADIVTGVSHKNFHEECRSNPSSACMPGPCDPKEWDVCYFSTSDKLDFLPTCYVIEEVVGQDSWDDGARDVHGNI